MCKDERSMEELLEDGDEIISGPLPGNGIAEIAKTLLDMPETEFVWEEFLLLDLYLARIDPQNPRATRVVFSKEDYEKLADINRLRRDRFARVAEQLFAKQVKIEDPDNGGYTKIHLFSIIRMYTDKKTRRAMIMLGCTPEAKTIFFGLEKGKYIRHQLQDILKIKDMEAAYLYLYLLRYAYRRSWAVRLDDLMLICRIKKTERFSFRDYHRRVLAPAVEKINAATKLHCEYELIKEWRAVSGIRFTVFINAPGLEGTYVPKLEPEGEDYPDFEFLRTACDGEFSLEEMKLIFNRIKAKEICPGLPFYEATALEQFSFLYDRYKDFAGVRFKNGVRYPLQYFLKVCESYTTEVQHEERGND